MKMKDLPQVCPSEERIEWLWKCHLQSHKTFAVSGNETTGEDEENLRKSCESGRGKFCSVNAIAALDMELFRRLFDSCSFQSPTLLTRTLKPGSINPKWHELGCEKNVTSS